MTSTSTLTLTTAVTPHRHYQALRDGTVQVPGVEIAHVEQPQTDIFRGMARELAFDVAEMSMVSYLCAKQYGIPFSAIPVVPRTAFHHGDFLVNLHAGIREPKDLEGRRVGTRTYTVTPGTLDRGILIDEYGVDVGTIHWVCGEPEHVPQCTPDLPPNVTPGTGEDLFPRLADGDLDAGIAGSNLNRSESPNVAPLFPDALELDRAQFRRTGIVQPFTVIVVKDALLEAHPWLAEALFEGFRAAKAVDASPDPRVVDVVGGEADPLPYGREANRAGFEEIIRLAHTQHIIARPFTVDELFPALD